MKTGVTQAAERLTLGDDDLAVLARLRAVALLCRAATPALPVLSGLQIGLETHNKRRLYPVKSVDWDFCVFAVQVLGWASVAKQAASSDSFADLIEGVYDRISEGEFPRGGSPTLVWFLRRIRKGLVGAAALAALTSAGWRTCPGRALITPILPDRVSAHEALEALVAAEEAGGLGSGPLGLLARQAAADLVFAGRS